MGHSGVGSKKSAAYWLSQKARTQTNKNEQRAAHAAAQPNDRQSKTQVKRWRRGGE